MNASLRGVLVLAGMLAVAAVFCYLIPFVLLPSIDSAVALPVIYLPGEILFKDVPILGTFTNTLMGTILADIVVLFIAFQLRNPKQIPQGFQNFFEIVTDALLGLTKQIVGVKDGLRIFPLVATIFLLVLAGNWWALIPGVDSVGIIHCAEDGFSGYPIQNDAPEDGEDFTGIAALKVTEALDSGTLATHENYEACNKKYFPKKYAKDHPEDESHSDDESHDEDVVASAEGENGDNTEATDGEGNDTDNSEATDEEHSEDEEAHGDEHSKDADPDLLVVTPFVRVAATDLNMTLSLALISFFFIQYYGIQTLGMGYFTKFINLPALGNLGKKPLGLIDFAVGILEIVSELSKIVSFGFRLFGNIFAGQVVLFVTSFLVAAAFPAIFYGLELFVGLIQAFVFYILTTVFISMAMEDHHGDEHDDHH